MDKNNPIKQIIDDIENNNEINYRPSFDTFIKVTGLELGNNTYNFGLASYMAGFNTCFLILEEILTSPGTNLEEELEKIKILLEKTIKYDRKQNKPQ